jgi:hypothetical protein
MKLWFNPLTFVILLVILGTSPIWLLLASVVWYGVIEPMWFIWLGMVVYYISKRKIANEPLAKS